MAVLGLLWAVLAPLLAVGLAVAAYRVVRRMRPRGNRRAQLVLCVGAPALLVIALYLTDRVRFAAVCDTLISARINEHRLVDGFFLDDSTANSFGMRYLHEEGFAWIEARSIYARERFTRYRREATGIASEEIDALTATVRVAAEHESRSGGLSIQRTVVTDRASGRELARGELGRFDGGRARWALGLWGSADCRNPASTQGNRDFQDWYHLARNTLRSESATAAPGR